MSMAVSPKLKFCNRQLQFALHLLLLSDSKIADGKRLGTLQETLPGLV
jgi:hypothetical protein